MSYKLFLDDVRDPKKVTSYIKDNRYKSKDWKIAKDYSQFVAIVEKEGLPSLVSFDHDLAPEHYDPSMVSVVAYNRLYNTFSFKTGLDCARYLIAYCEENGLDFPEYMVHSLNPAGKFNIELEIERWKLKK